MSSEQAPHPEALENLERAYIPEDKIRYCAFRDPHKSRVFAALGFSEEAGNWEALRNAVLERLPYHPAVFNKQNQWGFPYKVIISTSGPGGSQAPVSAYWFFEQAEEPPRLISLYIDSGEGRRTLFTRTPGATLL